MFPAATSGKKAPPLRAMIYRTWMTLVKRPLFGPFCDGDAARLFRRGEGFAYYFERSLSTTENRRSSGRRRGEEEEEKKGALINDRANASGRVRG